jgi:transcriptional regulator with XRE-family HTH domain
MDAAAWVRSNREALGWSQRRLAAAVGVTQGAVSQWENGGGLTMESLTTLSRVFGASLKGVVGKGTDFPGEMVEREDELRLLYAYRAIASDRQAFVLDMLFGGRSTQDPANSPAEQPIRRVR